MFYSYGKADFNMPPFTTSSYRCVTCPWDLALWLLSLVLLLPARSTATSVCHFAFTHNRG